MSTMEVICLESKALYALADRLVEHIKGKEKLPAEDKWITPIEAKRLLRISSNTTLQKLRDNGKIRFTQPSDKKVLYDRDSLHAYLERHAKDTFL